MRLRELRVLGSIHGLRLRESMILSLVFVGFDERSGIARGHLSRGVWRDGDKDFRGEYTFEFVLLVNTKYLL